MHRRDLFKRLPVLAVGSVLAIAAIQPKPAEAQAADPIAYAVEVDPWFMHHHPEAFFDSDGYPRQIEIVPGQAVVVPGKVVPITGFLNTLQTTGWIE